MILGLVSGVVVVLFVNILVLVGMEMVIWVVFLVLMMKGLVIFLMGVDDVRGVMVMFGVGGLVMGLFVCVVVMIDVVVVWMVEDVEEIM